MEASHEFHFKLKTCGKHVQILSLSLEIKRFKVITKSHPPFKMYLRASSWFSKTKALSNNFNTAVTKKKQQQQQQKQTSKDQTTKKINK